MDHALLGLSVVYVLIIYDITLSLEYGAAFCRIFELFFFMVFVYLEGLGPGFFMAIIGPLV